MKRALFIAPLALLPSIAMAQQVPASYRAPMHAPEAPKPPAPPPTPPAFVPIDEATFKAAENQILDRMPTRQGEPMHQALEGIEAMAKQRWVEEHRPKPIEATPHK